MASRLAFEGAQGAGATLYCFDRHGGAWMEPINAALNSVMPGERDVDTAIAEAQGRLDQLMAD